MIVIVVGMHRSGTSALAGLLHQHGIPMGEARTFRPRPSPENPSGYYENIRFRRTNDRILADSGYRVKEWNPAIPPVNPGRASRWLCSALLAWYRRRHPAWGWKDPRTCLTLSTWLNEINRHGWHNDVRVVHVWRDMRSVAHSLVARGNTGFEVAVQLWTAYNQRVIQTLQAQPVASFVIRYEDLCHQTAAATGPLFDFLEIAPQAEAIDAFIDQRLDRSSSVPRTPDISEATRQAADLVDTELDAWGRRSWSAGSA